MYFVDMMLAHSLLPTISRATRITEQTETLIDNFYTNSETQISSGNTLTNDISDHFPMYNITKVNIASTSKKAVPKQMYITTSRAEQFCAFLDKKLENFTHINPRPVGLWRPTRPVGGGGPFCPPPPRYLENHATQRQAANGVG